VILRRCKLDSIDWG